LGAAVNKLLDESPGENNELKLQTLLTNYKASHKDLQKIVLRTSESIHIVDVEDIVHCESDNNYTTFYLKDSQKILVSKGLKEYDEMLTDQGFYRAHQSHLVNLRYISRFDKRDGGFLVLTDKSQIPVSQRKRQGLLDIFDKM
jgi:two-component system LytT family response regulator